MYVSRLGYSTFSLSFFSALFQICFGATRPEINDAGGGGSHIGSQQRIMSTTGNGETEQHQHQGLEPRKPCLWQTDTVTKFDCNLDDCTGEQLAFVVELLFQNGALDVWITPVIMKKGRPGHVLSCLCREHDGAGTTVDTLLELVFRHTTTLGVRIHRGIERAKLVRETVQVSIPPTPPNDNKQGSDTTVDVKVARFTNGEVINAKAEFEQCRNISLRAGASSGRHIPIKAIAEKAVNKAKQTLEQERTEAIR